MRIYPKWRKIVVLSIVCYGILVSSFSLNWGIIHYASATTNIPSTLLGNLSNINVTVSDALELVNLTEGYLNHTRNLIDESNGNLTKWNMLLIDDLGKRGILNEAEKKVLSSYIIRLSQNNTSADIELINNDLGVLVDGLEKNSTNVEFIALASAMKKRVGDQRVVDPLPGSPVVIGEFTDAFKDMRSTGCMMIAVGGWGALGAGVGQVVCDYVQ